MALYDASNKRIWQEDNERILKMNHDHMDRLNISLSDINVYIGDSVRQNTEAAFRRAITMRNSPFFRKTLIINTSTRQHWALRLAREVDDTGLIGDEMSKDIAVIGISTGDLCNEFAEIVEKVKRHKFGTIIINSWEFASANARYKDKLLFQLRDLVENRGTTIVIYSHQTRATVEDIGKATRGKLGNLSAVAGVICRVSEDQVHLARIEKAFADFAVYKAAKAAEEAAKPKEEKSEQFVNPEGVSEMWEKVEAKFSYEAGEAEEETDDVNEPEMEESLVEEGELVEV